MSKKKQQKHPKSKHGESGHLCDDACEHRDDPHHHDDPGEPPRHEDVAGHAPRPAHSAPAAGGIYLISPSSAVHNPESLDLACQRLAAEGFKTRVDRAARAVHQRFAGTDKQRLAGLA
ncbi:MAG TPA: LD-carboxypeptidase, partial [Bordetella sp.]